jgi:hypothetical protein
LPQVVDQHLIPVDENLLWRLPGRALAQGEGALFDARFPDQLFEIVVRMNGGANGQQCDQHCDA